MPLPDETAANQPWPPPSWAPIQKDIAEAAAWYAGDANTLAGFYGGIANPESRSTTGRKFFWNRSKSTSTAPNPAQRLHVPVAADVAATAADLLFGATPLFLIPEAHGSSPDKTAEETELYLKDRVESTGLAATLSEGAEIASGLSGVFLRPYWDRDLSPFSMLTIVHPDHAVPEWHMGVLVAVTFWSTVATDGDRVWRHLERYEDGRILHGLYEGTLKELGTKQALAAMPATRGIEVDDDEDDAIVLPDSIGLAARYVPNVGPNRRHRGIPVGRSDCAGTEPLMDALDEAMSSWMRDLRLGKKRIIVPDEFLDRKGRGAGAEFDEDREIFSPLEMDPTHMDSAGITPVEMDLRVEEHEKTVMALFTQIVQTAGYSPQSFGLPGSEGSNQTATEVDARQDRSERTTEKKQGYWQRPLEDVLHAMLIIDAELLGQDVVPFRPRVEWPAAKEQDMREAASTSNLLALAKSASTRTRVKLLHKDWDDTEIDAEVALILAELTTVSDPTGGFV